VVSVVFGFFSALFYPGGFLWWVRVHYGQRSKYFFSHKVSHSLNSFLTGEKSHSALPEI